LKESLKELQAHKKYIDVKKEDDGDEGQREDENGEGNDER
jgi:hypothetical protein